MKKKLSIILVLSTFLTGIFACNSTSNSSLSSSSISESKEVLPTSIEIEKDNVNLTEVTINVDQEYPLSVKVTPQEASDEVFWKSSDPSICSVSTNGVLKGLKEGSVIISATSLKADYISKSIFVKVTTPVQQLGVGTGLTSDDPIFKGNEGKDEPLEIYFIEMQHIYADSIFIKKGNVEVLIDSGYEYDGQFVGKFIDEHLSDGRLDLLMASHSDGDHINGFDNALKNVDNISLMIDYGGVGGGCVKHARDKYVPLGGTYHSAIDCASLSNGASNRYYLTSEFYFDVLNTGRYISNSDGNAGNANSLAVIFYYRDFKFFTAGDLTTDSESSLMRNEVLPEVTLYKASHHGSHGSNSQELLDTLNPKGVAISAARAGNYNATPGPASKDNTYNLDAKSGHPAAAAIERIYKAPNISKNLNVYWNAVNGTMKFTTYGEDSFEFAGSETMRGYYDLTLTDNVPVWDDSINNFKNKVTGEENKKFHETKAFAFRNYQQYLPDWAK